MKLSPCMVKVTECRWQQRGVSLGLDLPAFRLMSKNVAGKLERQEMTARLMRFRHRIRGD